MTVDKVIEIIAKEAEIDKSEIKPDSSLSGELEIESMTLLTLALQFEENFNVTFKKAELPLMKTPADIAAMIEQKLQ